MTTPGRPLGCSQPIGPDILMDYWLAALTASDEEAVEEHLLACDQCGDRLRETIALAEGLRTLAQSGSLVVVVADQTVKHAAASGQRVREYTALPGEGVQCTVSADDDLLVARLAANLSGATRVDLSWCNETGLEVQRMVDIPVRPDAGAVLCQQSITMAKAAPTGTMIARLVAVDPGDVERLLGEYSFHHTRTIPGPPSW